MSAPPYMKLYVADYLGDTHHLSAIEHGAYVLLLMGMWRAGGTLPAADANLSRLARCTPAEWETVKAAILPFFKRSRGKLTHKRITAEMAKYETVSRHRSEAGKAGAAKKAQKDSQLAQANAGRLPTKPEPEPEPKKEEAKASVATATKTPKARIYPEDFEAAWKAYPHHKGRSSKPNAAAQFAKLPADEREGMVAAIGRFVPNVAEATGGKGAQDMATWLRDGKHLNWTADTTGAVTAVATFDAPVVRASIVKATDEDFARRYVDHYCRWVNDGRRLEARDQRVLPVLTGKLSAWAARNDVTIALMSDNDAPALFAEESAA